MIRPLEAIGYLWLVWLVGWMLAALTAARSVMVRRVPRLSGCVAAAHPSPTPTVDS